jgi:hypothetical protein
MVARVGHFSLIKGAVSGENRAGIGAKFAADKVVCRGAIVKADKRVGPDQLLRRAFAFGNACV